MRYWLLILFLFSKFSYGQSIFKDSGLRVTIYLQPFKADKIVAYKFDSVTILVKLEDFKKEIDELWRTYRAEQKDNKFEKRRGEGYSKRTERTWHFVDSLKKVLLKSSRNGDTVFIGKKEFRAVHLSDLNNFFPYMIEKNQCTILDNSGQVHLTIIRETFAVHAPGGSYGGNRYFLPGDIGFFIEAETWET